MIVAELLNKMDQRSRKLSILAGPRRALFLGDCELAVGN